MIVKEGRHYFVKSHDGKKTLGGPYSSHEAAAKRLQEIEYFKHRDMNRRMLGVKGAR